MRYVYSARETCFVRRVGVKILSDGTEVACAGEFFQVPFGYRERDDFAQDFLPQHRAEIFLGAAIAGGCEHGCSRISDDVLSRGRSGGADGVRLKLPGGLAAKY